VKAHISVIITLSQLYPHSRRRRRCRRRRLPPAPPPPLFVWMLPPICCRNWPWALPIKENCTHNIFISQSPLLQAKKSHWLNGFDFTEFAFSL
jgi:hypothetical protein